MSERIYSIDSVRAIAMVFIVAIHAEPFRGLGTYGNAANFVIDTTARFAVPFFFLTAGYLFARKIARTDSGGYVTTYLSRVGGIYLWGLVLYFPIAVFLGAGAAVQNGQAVSNAVFTQLLTVLSPIGVLYYGDSVAFHLWFLPALMLSITLLYAFVAFEKTRYILPIAIALHIVGLLGESYTMGLAVPLETRDALFFGFFYTSLGYCFHSWEWSPRRDRSSLYLTLTALFAVAHLGERYVLGYVLTGDSIQAGVYAPEYSVMTAFFSAALFVFVLSNPTFGKSTRLPTIGTYAVVIYVLHPIVLYGLVGVSGAIELAGYDIGATIVWQLALTPAAYFGTLGLSLVAKRSGVTTRAGHTAASERLKALTS